MFKLFLALHLLTAVFAIGPLVGAVTTAARGLRTGDAAATRSAARTAKIYAYVSIVVVILGFALMSMKSPDGKPGSDKPVADFGDLWIWLSVLLWVVAMVLTLAVVVPSLEKATVSIGKSEAVSSLTGRVAASGGVVGLVFAAIVFLMVYRPGS